MHNSLIFSAHHTTKQFNSAVDQIEYIINIIGKMKSNQIVTIDAHIIRCRIHHNNTNKYSITLKLGKNQQQSTQYFASTDSTIEIDAHLHFKADKPTFDTFPKFSLIVSLIGENKQQHIVGTTFANYKLEGLQVYKVAECSCKNKAFQVELMFILKIIDLKNGKNNNAKKQQIWEKNVSENGHQLTSKQSVYKQLQTVIKPKRQHKKVEHLQRVDKLKSVRSQKVIRSNIIGEELTVKYCKQQYLNLIEELQIKIISLQERINIEKQTSKDYDKKYLQLKVEVQKQNINVFVLQGLLKLEQQKNVDAFNYIKLLQVEIQKLITGNYQITLEVKSVIHNKPFHHKKDFKIIQQTDEIILQNQELTSELQRYMQQNQQLLRQIQNLKLCIDSYIQIINKIQIKQVSNLLTSSTQQYSKSIIKIVQNNLISKHQNYTKTTPIQPIKNKHNKKQEATKKIETPINKQKLHKPQLKNTKRMQSPTIMKSQIKLAGKRIIGKSPKGIQVIQSKILLNGPIKNGFGLINGQIKNESHELLLQQLSQKIDNQAKSMKIITEVTQISQID